MLIVKIDDKEFDYFTSVSLNLTYDKPASTFDLALIVDPNNDELKPIYTPLGYNNIKIYVDEEIVFTGVFLSHTGAVHANQRVLSITGYSLCGVLNDCSLPHSIDSFQDDGQNLKQICQKYLKPFRGVELFTNQIAQEKASKSYEKAQGEPTDKVASYLARLASQRDLIVGNTRLGELLLTKLRITEPYVGEYEEGQDGVASPMEWNVNGQELHSEVNVVNQSNFFDDDKASFKATGVIDVYRPLTMMQKDGDINDGQDAANSIINAELKAIQYTMIITTHRYMDGTVIKPNRRLTLKAPSAMLFERTELFVEDVVLSTDTNGDTARLTLIPIQAKQ